MKRYQAVAFLLSTAMTVSSVAPVFGASNDVFGHWAELTITKWQNEGRIGGYEDGTFKPDKAITRAEFVRLLNSAAPTAFTASTSINFSDVKESDWFYADVAKAVGGRVASGFEDGTFRPGETVTRMQAAVFICNAKGLTPNEAAANNFTDAASIPAWAKGAVGAAVAAGYLSGYPDGSFGGSKGMTRAEAVSTLDRVLGGGSTTTTTPSGEIDTSDRDNSNTEDNRTAEAGNMVWTSGGGGGSSKKSSSSSSSSSDKKTHNVTIRSQKEANDYEGKTLTGTTEIYVDGSGIDLKDIRFKGDVDIYADDTVAAAYIGKDTAVAAANSTVDIYFEGKTNVSGTITVIRNNVAGADKVVIRTRTPRALSASVLAKVATKIVGFEISRVEAQAPVEIAEGAKVNTVEAGDNASVEVAEDASVDKVDVTGDAKDIVLNGEGSTDVTVKSGASADNIVVDSTEATVELEGSAKVDSVAVVGDGAAAVKVNDNAKVENVQVSDNASADVAVADKATVNKVELSDTATAKVDVAEDAKVNTISSTSTGKTEVSGEGTVDKIEATDPSTVDTSNAGENIPTVDKKEEDKPSTPATTTITAAQLKDVALTTPKAASEKASVTGLPTGVKQEGTTWTAATASTPAAQTGETGDGTTGDGTGSGDSGTTTPDDGNDSGTDTPSTPTTKAHTATITLTADTGYVFDTAITTADLTGLASAIQGEVTVSATEIKFTVKADIAVTPEDPDTPVDPTPDTTPASITLKSSVATPVTLKQGASVVIDASVLNKDDEALDNVTDFEWVITDGAGTTVEASNEKVEITKAGQKVTIKNLTATSTDKIKVSAKVGTVTVAEANIIEITMSEEVAAVKSLAVTASTSTHSTGNFRPTEKVTFTVTGKDGENGSGATVDIPAGGTYAWSTTDSDYSAAVSAFDTANPELTITEAGLTAGATTTKDIPVTVTWTPSTGTATTGTATIKAEPAAVAKTVAVDPKTATVQKSKTQQFTAEVKDQYGEVMAEEEVTWSVEDNIDTTGTKVQNGLLTVSASETATTLTVKATNGTGDNEINGTATVTVTNADQDTNNPTITALTVAPTSVSLSSSDTADKEVTITLKGSNFDATGAKPVTLSYTLKDDKGQTVTKGTNTGFVSGSSVAETLEVAAADINTTGKEVKFKIDKAQASATLEITATYDGTAFATKPTVTITQGSSGGNEDNKTAINSAKLAAVTCVKGDTPVTTLAPAEASGTTANYEVAIEWKSKKGTDAYGDPVYDADNKFAGGNQYKAVITLTAKTDFKFAPASEGGEIKVTLGTEEIVATLNADGTLTVEKEFTALELEPIASIAFEGTITAPKATDENLADLTSITKPNGADVHYTVTATGWTKSATNAGDGTRAVDAGTYTATVANSTN